MATQCLEIAFHSELEYEEMAKLDVLEERVNNHITYFKWAFVVLGGWLGWVSVQMYQTKSSVTGIAQTQANAPAQIVSALLNKPAATTADVQANLAAAASVLQSTKIGKIKPDAGKLKPISDTLTADLNQYPDMAQAWSTTAVFINYKSEALVKNSNEIITDASTRKCEESVTQHDSGWVYENCTVLLETVAKLRYGNKMNGRALSFTFKNCVIDYYGGDLPDGPMIFKNSLFRFSVNTIPPRRGTQTILRIAQSEDPSFITVPSA